MYTRQILSAPLDAAGPIVAGEPGGSHQSVWEWGDGEVEVGIWEATPGTFDGTTGDFDEMMCMAAGRVSVSHDDGVYDIAPGTAWVTPRRWNCQWTVHETVRKLYVIDHRSGDTAPAAYLANAHTQEMPAFTPRPGAIDGDPHESTAPLWAHNGLQVGVWEATPGVFPASRIGYDEVFICLSGRASMTTSDGVRLDLGPGSVLLTPNGFTGTWHVTEQFRKVYCIINR